MRLPSPSVQRGLQINMTPLIDVVFLTIIFFLVASTFMRHGQAEKVELPNASQGRDEDEVASRVIVTVMPDKRLLLGGSEVTVAEIESKLQLVAEQHGPPATELRIRADRSVPYSIVEPILLASARVGVTKVRFAVLPK